MAQCIYRAVPSYQFVESLSTLVLKVLLDRLDVRTIFRDAALME